MNSHNLLVLKQLDHKMQKFKFASNPIAPPNGWIRAIRTALGMPRRSLAKKLGITAQGLMGIEEREVTGSITLRTLRETAELMDLVLIYGFVPKDGSLQNFVKRKSYEAAKKIVLRTAHTMALEDQAISDNRIKAAIKEKAQELESKLPSFLWE
jgi:predicted DNA-binding mobile mystery protein A